MNTDFDQLIDNLALELEALSIARQAHKNCKTSDAPREWEKLGAARRRVEDAQEKLNDATMTVAIKRATELAAKKQELITPDALVKLGFVLNGRGNYWSGSERQGVMVMFTGYKNELDYVAASDPGDGEMVIAEGVKNLADIKTLYRLVTGETLGDVK